MWPQWTTVKLGDSVCKVILLISPLSMWDENRLLGSVDLFFFFQLSCHFLVPSGFPEEKCQQLADIVQTFDHHEFCYLFLPPKLEGILPLWVSLYHFSSTIQVVHSSGSLSGSSLLSVNSEILSTLLLYLHSLRGFQVHHWHHIHLYIDDSQMKVKKKAGEISSATFL